MPLVWFLIGFPILVFAGFLYLVTRHAEKLYGPGDFKDETNYLHLITAASSLAAASARKSADADAKPVDVGEVVDIVRSAAEREKHVRRRRQPRALWVDDRPDNNVLERRALEAIGLRFTLAESTDEAVDLLRTEAFDVIISDMGRREGPEEGYALLEKVRSMGRRTPFFIYAGSNAPKHRELAAKRGAQGTTNQPGELFEMVTASLAMPGLAASPVS